ncbi:MAG: hypothetical protein KC931_04450, partial [Candidatus Omnitrophica bacterium]|nr:hypothetical protein [Candidatus Omnitrophota bacterium]
EQAPYFFQYDTTAGLLLEPPFPLNLLGASQDTSDVDTNPATTHSFQDRKFNIWAMAGPDSLSDPTPEIDIKFWYQPIGDFYIPTGSPTNEVGDVPFLGSLVSPATDPVEVTYRVEWPQDVPELRVGETLYKPKFGLPDISLPCSVGIIYQQATRLDPSKISVQTIDPTKAHSVDLEELSGDMNVEPLGGDVAFPDLPPHLASRLRYNPIQEELTFFGLYVDQDLGEDYFLPNVFSDSEAQIMKDLEGADQAFRDAIDELQMIAADDLVFSETETELDRLALSAGVATGDGYVVLAMQNSETVCDPALPISLEIIRVTCPLAEGQIAVIPASCVFDEKLTLKHTNDLAGQTDDYVFEWATQPAVGGLIPDRPTGQGGDGWVSYPGGTGEGVTFITIEGPGLFTLSDNWFSMRYRPASASDVVCATNDTWSRWTQPQLAEGWVKRVLAGINPFDQRFEDLSDPTRTINTQVNMISQAGPRWEGSVALNCDSVDDFGLIEIYETVYQRAVDLSIGAPIPVDYPPANDALLLVSSKLADLYGLLGNEAFADASDPTISFGISSDETFLQAVTSVHAFENMTSSLTEEELALLRGRDDRLAPPVTTPPVYNRLVWNFSRDLGEVAYALNYDIQDTNGNADGEFSETDARLTYPQGHGDAWGHYLTAINNYYRLLQDENFTWIPRAEAILIGGAPVTVDFIDEQKFIRSAAARARTGAQIVGLTHRQFYSEDPAEQWKGYKDSDPDRGWGLAEWGSRVGQAALFDWVVGNAMLPEPEEGAPVDITKIDRQSATDLRVLASEASVVQEEVDKADIGLNPLGLARNVMPFDIDPSLVDEGMTHFEQIYERAIVALSNAATVFNFANETTQQLRKQADSLDEYKRVVKDGETDFRNRLIETFGTPYADDIGPAGTYPTGYRGPDIYHYDYVEPSELRDEFLGQSFDVPVTEFLVNFTDSAFSIDNPDNTLNVLINDASNEDGIDAATNVEYFERTVEYNVSTDGLGLVKPEGWGRRRVTGRLQETRSDLLQLYAEYRMALSDYTGIIDEIIDTADLIEERFGIRADQIDLMESTANTIATMDVLIGSMQLTQFALEASKDTAKEIANAIAEALPKSSGTSNDVTSAGRGATKAAAASTGANIDGYIGLAMGVELAAEFTKTQTELWNNIEIAELDAELEARENLLELQNLVRNEETLRFDLFGRLESLQQAGNAYLATLDEGLRTLDSFHRFRTETAADIQESRYKDMAFRVFRDDLIQKYRGQFDLAARYAYLAARAYDFETNLLETDSRGPGQNFLTDIVRSRAIGIVQDNDGDGIFNPETAQEFGDPGLSDILARMNLNWNLNLKGQLGFNNPQAETNRFSLRQELYRVAPSPESATGPTMSDETWQMVLDTNTVENVLSLPEFERFARPFFPQNPTEPAIVIPFSTRINFGSNFFGRELATGDSAYNSTNFATKIRSVGVWFEGYENAGLADDPQVYLVPVGQDILRSPTGLAGEIRSFTLLDQVLPVPFPVGPTIQNDPDWLPSDQLTGSFGNIRRYSSFKAFPDSGDFEPDETTTNSRLIGRSVWNTRWVLIIPAGTMLNDRDEALRRFKENVTDILIFFQTYAYSGNK